MKKVLLFLVIILVSHQIVLSQTPINPSDWGQIMTGYWEFDDQNNISDATVGDDMSITGGVYPIMGPTSSNGAVRIPQGDFLKCDPNIDPTTSSGTYVNSYTLLFDIKVKQLGRYYTLFNTDLGNSGHGDFYIDPSGKIGSSVLGYSTDAVIKANRWLRLVLSFENGSFFKAYINGTLVFESTNNTVDGDYAIDDPLHLFTDGDYSLDNEIDVAAVAIFYKALDNVDIWDLGGYDIELLSEDFENGFNEFQNATGNNVDFTIDTTLHHSGSYCARNAYLSNNDNVLLQTQKLDLTDFPNAILEFWHIAKTKRAKGKCYVEISTDNGSNWSVLPASTYENTASDYNNKEYFDEASYVDWGFSLQKPGNWAWKKEIFDLSNYSSSSEVKIRFRIITSSNTDTNSVRIGWFIDDIHIFQPFKQAPLNQKTVYTSETTAKIRWSDNGTASKWILEYGPKGFTLGNGIGMSVTSSYIQLSGLSDSTEYDWYVSSVYGDTNRYYTDTTGPGTFRTRCQPANVPYEETFDNTSWPDFPHCLTIENTNKDNFYWKLTSGSYASAPNSAMLSYSDYNDDDDWIFTRGINLQAGIKYSLTFSFRKSLKSGTVEKLAVDWGDDAYHSNMSGTPLYDNNNITNTDWDTVTVTVEPTTTDVYYFGFHAYSSQTNARYLFIDDIKVDVAKTYWTGDVNTDWENSGNWTNGVPNDSVEAVIPKITSASLPNYPIIVSGQEVSTYKLTVESNASLTVDEGALTVNGTTDNSGSFEVTGDGKFVFKNDFTNNGNVNILKGSFSDSYNASINLNNYGTFSIAEGGRVVVYGNTVNTGNFLIHSSSYGTGLFIPDNITGTIKVQRFVHGGRWNMISPSTSGVTAGDLMDIDPNNDSWLTYFVESEGPAGDTTHGLGWHYITPVNTVLNTGTGYCYWPTNDETLVFEGNVLTVDFPYSISYSGPNYGFNLVGNPYTAPVRWDSVGEKWNLNNVDGTIWIYNGTQYNPYPSNTLYYNIAVGQGFFVRATGNNPAMTVPEAARTTNSSSFVKGEIERKEGFNYLSIKAENNGLEDNAFIYFDQKGTDEYDWGYDAEKMFGSSTAPQLFVKEEEMNLAYAFLPDLDEGSERTVSLNYIPGVSGEQKLIFDLENFHDINIVLEDVKTGILQDINENNVYEFTGFKTDDPARFLLHFTRNITGLNNNKLTNEEVNIYSYAGNIYVKMNEKITDPAYINVYDLTGKKLFSSTINKGKSIKRLYLHNYKGYVIVKVICGATVKTDKVFVH